MMDLAIISVFFETTYTFLHSCKVSTFYHSPSRFLGGEQINFPLLRKIPVQFPHSFGQIARTSAKTVLLHKIATPEN